MIADLHNHTPLCNHAKGSPEEFIQKAVEQKINLFGFSDHAPMKFDEGYRMTFEQMDGYEALILDLKKRYKDKIDIKLAYEVDYLPGYVDKRVLDRDVDYLIGSVHFIDSWGFDNPEFIGEYANKDATETWTEYFRLISEMAKTNAFNIVGHIDLLKVFNFKQPRETAKMALKAIEEIKKAGMAIEINASGLRKPVGEAYPSNELLRAILEFEVPITFGSDSHDPDHIGFKMFDNMELAKSIGFKNYAYFENRKMHLINF